jgi:hypothetical protein
VTCALNRGADNSGPGDNVLVIFELHIGELKSDSDMGAFLRLVPSTSIASLQSRAAVLGSGARRKIGGDMPLDLVEDAAQFSNVRCLALVLSGLSIVSGRKWPRVSTKGRSLIYSLGGGGGGPFDPVIHIRGTGLKTVNNGCRLKSLSGVRGGQSVACEDDEKSGRAPPGLRGKAGRTVGIH